MGRTSTARERLLEAARNLIWKQSYGAVTIDAICEEAGVRKGSFYYFFESKSDLALAAFDELWKSIKPRLEEIFSSETPPLERLENYFRFTYQRQAELKKKHGQVVGCPFASLASELVQQEEDLAAKARSVITATRKYIEAALRDAQSEGLIEVRSIPSTAQKLTAFVDGSLLQARVQNSLDPIRDLGTASFLLIGAQSVAA
jgi:TetR/AcrR family transcriptional repressor of nem operon